MYQYQVLAANDVPENMTTPITAKNDLQKTWNSKLAITSMVPNVATLIINALAGHR